MDSFAGMRSRVVAIADEGWRAFDRGSGLDTARVGSPRLPNRINVGLLNASGLREAARFRPDVVLSGHMVCSPAAAALRRLTRVPYVQYVYAEELSATPGLARFAMQHAHTTIAISRYTQELAERIGTPQRMELVLPGVDLPATVERGSADRPTILTIASLFRRYKGHDVMIRALPLIKARVPDVEWVVVGSGPLEPLYRSMVSNRRLDDHVRFCGWVTAEERDLWLDAAQVFAMPSRLGSGGGGGEGFGIVYLEAGAHQVPVVAGNVAGALDAVVDGETGILVDPTDHVQVAGALADLLLDSERAARMGEAGARWAADHAWAKVSARVEEILLAAVRG